MGTGELRLDNRTRDDAVVVVPEGRLGPDTYQQLRDHLLKIGADAPRAVLVDLARLHVDATTSLAIFTSVHTRLAQWPGVPMLLVAGDESSREAVANNKVARFVPVHDSVPAALAAVDEPPPRRIASIRLGNDLTGPRAGREFARQTCAEWAVDGIDDDAALLVGELVSNAVVHTDAAPLLRLDLRGGVFSVAVYDDRPGEVSVRDPGGSATEVHGLLLVAQVAAAWGCSPTTGGGKVVWATLRTG